MHDPVNRPHPVMGELCPYHWISIPARNGTSTRTNGASFQNNIEECICISELFNTVPYASTGIRGEDKKTTHSILKRTRLTAKKIKQVVSGKDPEMGLGQKKFPQVFVENKGLEEICRRVFTGILDS